MAIRNWYYLLIIISVGLLTLLGSWWLYLVFNLAYKLEGLNHPSLEGNLINMVKWEGTTFVVLLLILSILLVYVYILDHRKTKALQEFFASLTHELKTPLASMKLQTQVISEFIENSELHQDKKDKVQLYAKRLIDDSLKLEDQLDNHLQLSRVERKANLNLRPIEFTSFIEKEKKRYPHLPEIVLLGDNKDFDIMADDFALETIIRNLFENSLTHNHDLKKITLTLKKGSFFSIHYNDHGPEFKGDSKNLGELFYKFNSPSGSGIGLYLIKKLMLQMNGQLEIKTSPHVEFCLSFRPAP
ncbi:MAG: hypothetical protein CME62_09740 [Halobacteriovoraceae bacterium]|nr:hypothetical protein [Halobacteriovoraceae bacterium]|tara:strand:+ start:14267 stop:15166 length:900 start_codon:yes stop_codon:yes gene_type:complete